MSRETPISTCITSTLQFEIADSYKPSMKTSERSGILYDFNTRHLQWLFAFCVQQFRWLHLSVNEPCVLIIKILSVFFLIYGITFCQLVTSAWLETAPLQATFTYWLIMQHASLGGVNL